MKKGNNNISTVSGDAFVGLQRIKFLNLEGNSIKAIGGNTLAHLSGCIILDLRNDYFYPSTTGGYTNSKETMIARLRFRPYIRLCIDFTILGNHSVGKTFL